MKTAYVIFYLDMEKVAIETEENQTIFPRNWAHFSQYDEVYSSHDSDTFKQFDSEKNAVLFIRANVRSNHIYKICKWVISENLKVFDNCPALVEVEQE